MLKNKKISNDLSSPLTLQYICYCARLSKAEYAHKIITFKRNI